MRDVTPPQDLSSLGFIKEHLLFIVHYLRHPIQRIKSLPDWPWKELAMMFIIMSIGSGVLTGFAPPNVYVIAAGLFIAPIISIIMHGLFTLILYYYFQIFENKTHSFRALFTLVFFANIPFFIFQIGSEVVPPITLIGFLFTAFLLIVGLTENFKLPKAQSIRLVGIIFFIVFIVWIINRIDIGRLERKFSQWPFLLENIFKA